MKFALLSKDGNRPYNEDTIGISEKNKQACFILADGLGGHGGGADASKLVTDTITDYFQENGITENFLENCFEHAQHILLKKQNELGKENQMKTTLVILTVDGDRLQWGHIGDSRLYVFEKGKYRTRTMDHSVPQMLVAAGQLKEKEIRGHSDRNRLLRVMGTEWEKPEYQIAEPIESQEGMAFLLCSDGFWELIVEKDMEKLLRKTDDPQLWLEKMEAVVRKNGKNKNMDNYSAIAVMV